MKKILFSLCCLLITAVTLFSCTKQMTDSTEAKSSLSEVRIDQLITGDVDAMILTHEQADSAWIQIAQTGLWSKDVWMRAVTEPLTPDERYNYLKSNRYASSRTDEPNMETIIRRNQTTLANVNGGAASWDCDAELLTYTIAQLGQPQAERAANNYYNAGSSRLRTTLSDVLRAANGFVDTTQDNILEIVDIVYEYQVSGDCNWLVGAVIDYGGTEYVFSSFEEVGGAPALIYDPEGDGMFIVGPMPGNVTSVAIDNQFSAPPCEL